MINVFLLKLLAKAFQEMAQDENNASEYKQLALYLVSEFFLDHRNKDVRLLVACCIADIFRVFAPEAPFTDSEVVKVRLLYSNKFVMIPVYIYETVMK